MPRTIQTKFFDELSRRCEAVDLELVVAYNFSNEGKLFIQTPQGFEAAVALNFSFQPRGVRLDGQAIFRGRRVPDFVIFDPTELGEAIDAIMAAAADPSSR